MKEDEYRLVSICCDSRWEVIKKGNRFWLECSKCGTGCGALKVTEVKGWRNETNRIKEKKK